MEESYNQSPGNQPSQKQGDQGNKGNQNSQGVPQPPPPFSCTYAPNVPELLQQMNISLAISTYQAGKVILISPKNRDELIQLPRNFQKPMGIAVDGRKMAIATREEIIILTNDPELAHQYPGQPGTYDAFFSPRATYLTNEVDFHDLEWSKGELWGVNTRFSCLSLINDDYSFTPKWKPSFISKLTPEDRCHLNGVAFVDGQPKYVTALGQTDTPSGWRNAKAQGGILMDIDANEIILDNLPMPHSPRVYNNELYMLLSGTGEIVQVDLKTRKYNILKSLNGFARGMDKHGDYLFIGLSKLRTTSLAFQDLPISKKSIFAGVVIMYLPTASIIGHIKYETSVEEIFDVRVLAGMQRPGLINTIKPEHKRAIATPEENFWLHIPEEHNNPSNKTGN